MSSTEPSPSSSSQQSSETEPSTSSGSSSFSSSSSTASSLSEERVKIDYSLLRSRFTKKTTSWLVLVMILTTVEIIMGIVAIVSHWTTANMFLTVGLLTVLAVATVGLYFHSNLARLILIAFNMVIVISGIINGQFLNLAVPLFILWALLFHRETVLLFRGETSEQS